MPSVPVSYSNVVSPTSKHTSPTFEEPLSSKELNEKANELCDSVIANLSRSVETSNLVKRPPLPPCILRRPASRTHVVGSSSIRSLSPSSLSSNLSYRSKSVSISPRPRSRIVSPTNFSTPPRRMYPMENAAPVNIAEEASIKEQAPVVFDASLNFVLGFETQKVRQSFKPTASHLEPATASSYLSSKISQFLEQNGSCNG